MPQIPEYTPATAAQLDGTNKFVIDEGGVTKSVTITELRIKLNQREPNTQTGSYTPVLGDDAKVIRINASSANDFTIPANSDVAFGIGTFLIVRQVGTGQTTIVADTGVTLNGAATELEQHKAAVLHKVDTNIWDVYIGGAGGASIPGDTTAPTIQTVAAPLANRIDVTFDEAIQNTTGFSFEQNGSPLTITGATIIADEVIRFTISETMLSTDTLTWDYTPGDIQDLAGNALAADSGAVANGIPAGGGGGVVDAAYDFLADTNTNTGLAYSCPYDSGGDFYQKLSGATNWGYVIGRTNLKLAAGSDGGHQMLVPDLSGIWTPNILMLHSANTKVDWTAANFALRIDAGGTGGRVFKILNGVELAVAHNLGFTGTGTERIGIFREGSDIKLMKSTDNGSSWATVYTFDPADIITAGLDDEAAGDLWAWADCRTAIKDPKLEGFT